MQTRMDYRKKYPMKIQKVDNRIINIPLRFNRDKNEWKKVIETNSFKNITITSQLGKKFEFNELSNEIVANENSN